MRRLVLWLVVPLCACSPGTSTVTDPDAGGLVDTDAPFDDATNANHATTDAAGTRDASGHDAEQRQPDATTTPDLGPSPSRVWTAETDGTIAWWTFDPANGSLTRDGAIERGGNLNFLAFSADRSRLYAINGSRVEGFDITSLPPTFLGDADAGLAGVGTHLAVDATRSHVFVAWYGDNAVSMLPLAADGSPGDATVILGGSADPGFCQRAHQIRVHPNNKFVYVPCLGSDHVVALSYDSAAGDLTPIDAYPTTAGTGPRHMDFHPSLPQAYVIGEQNDTITRFAVDATTGALTRLDEVSTRPSPGDTLGPASDVHVSADGRWVVGVNRNPRDEVVTFAAAADGSLSDPRWVATGGTHARTFTFTPGGGYLLLGNSNSQDVTVFTFADGTATQIDTVGGFDANLFFIGVQ